MSLRVFLLAITSNLVLSDNNVTVFPLNPYGIQDENLEIRVQVLHTFKTCSFIRVNGKINETLSSASSISGLEYWEDDSRSVCAMLVKPMLSQFKGTWTAAVHDAHGYLTNVPFNIFMNESPKVVTEVQVNAVVGSALTKSCVTTSTQRYAKVFRPDGNLFQEGADAEISIPFVTYKDRGVWKCVVQIANSLSQMSINININVTSTSLVEPTVTETKEQVQLLCRQSDTDSVPCIFETPAGVLLAPRAAVYTERYGYYGDGSSQQCGLSIRKPLMPEEVGVWKCLLSSPQHASFLQVGGNHSYAYNASEAIEKISVVSGMNLTIHCQLRQPLTYCYVRSPLGRVFSSMEPDHKDTAQYTGLGLRQGDCEISIGGTQVWANESGTWTCGMGTADNLDDVQVPIDVQIATNQFSAEKEAVATRVGDKVELKCSSVMGYGLAYCRFMHPSGHSLNLVSSSSADRFSYVGVGLDSGDCGLSIYKVEANDFGKWICAATFVGKQWPYEFRDTISLYESPMKTETLIGMSVALGLLALALVSGFIYWERGRRGRRAPNLYIADIRYSGSRILHGSEASEINAPATLEDSHSS